MSWKTRWNWCFYTTTCQVPTLRSGTGVAPIPTRVSATYTSLNVQADDRVECDTLYVTLYDSLEVMGSELREELSRVRKSGKLFYAVKEEELLKDFICL